MTHREILTDVSDVDGNEIAPIFKSIVEIGSKFDPEVLSRTRSLFEPLWSTDASDDLMVESISYGSEDRHSADVYWMNGSVQDRPVLVFVPGGGFVGGSRAGYKAFGAYFARQNYVVVIADYRVAPASVWPAGAEDVASIVEWVGEHAPRFHGSARNIFVLGHSAGGTHVAGVAFDARFRPANASDIRGFILISGIYQIDQNESRPNVLAYFGQDQSRFEDRSPISHIDRPYGDVLLMLAEYDPVPFARSAFALASTLTVHNSKAAQLHMAQGHNHISSVLAVGTSYDPITSLTSQFISDRYDGGAEKV